MTDQTLRQLFTSDEQIDDVARARIWSRLATRIEAPPARRRWLPVAGALAVAAAAAIVLVVARGGHEEQRLGAPQGTVLTTMLGPHANAALQGPAVLAVAQTGEVTRARLEEGTLYAEFTGGPGRALHITAAGADIEVVGTLFAVEVHGTGVCLSVAHGRVRIVVGGTERFVTNGERACAKNGVFTDDAPIETVMRDALERHARNWAPDASPTEAVALPDTAVPTSSAAPSAPVPPATAPAPAAPVARTSPAHIESAAAPAPDESGATTAPDDSASTTAPSTTPVTTATTTSPVASPPSTSAPATTVPGPAAPAATSPAIITTAAGSAASRAPAINPDEVLYRDADAALARGDRDAADRTLAKLLATSPRSPLADEALYERARIAVERKAWSDARALLARLKEIADTPLAEPGAYLRCRIAVASKEQDICAVLGTYLREYRDGPHVTEVTAAYQPRCGGEP